MQYKLIFLAITILFVGFVPACDNGSGTQKGNIQMYVEPEWTLINGIEPGEDAENIKDGWRVEYNTFYMSIGEVAVGKSNQTPAYTMNKHYIVDLKNTPLSGALVAEFKDVPEGHWDQVSYAMPAASEQSETLGTVPANVMARMKDNGLAVKLSMTLTKENGQRCPYLVNTNNPADPQRPCDAVSTITADWELPFPARAGGCQTELETGLTVPAGGTVAIKLTIHADHFFFTTFRHTDVTRIVQHIVDADLNADGEVTFTELEATPVTVLVSDIFDLSMIPGQLNTLLDYVRWATITLPHYQGDGGCPQRTPL